MHTLGRVVPVVIALIIVVAAAGYFLTGSRAVRGAEFTVDVPQHDLLATLRESESGAALGDGVILREITSFDADSVVADVSYADGSAGQVTYTVEQEGQASRVKLRLERDPDPLSRIEALSAGAGGWEVVAASVATGLTNASALIGDPGVVILCPEIEQRVTRQECQDYTRLANAARRGEAAFNAPDPMQRGETVTLELAISYHDIAPGTPTPAQTVESLPGDTERYQPLVGRHLSAELTGGGFEIEALSDESQEILPDSVTTWEWRVTAREAGSRQLFLKTAVQAQRPSGERVDLRSTTRVHSVTVRVGFLEWLAELLDGIPVWVGRITAILAALAAAVGAWWVFRRATKGKTAPPA